MSQTRIFFSRGFWGFGDLLETEYQNERIKDKPTEKKCSWTSKQTASFGAGTRDFTSVINMIKD